MKRHILLSAGLGVAAASAVTVVGPSSATAHPRTETFTIMSVSDPSTSTVIATGPFTAGGTDESGPRADHLRFPNGRLSLDHQGTSRTRMNPTTCAITTTGSGAFTLSGGTGAYRGMQGSGHYTFSVDVVLARAGDGTCDRNATPAAFEYVVTARAQVSS